MRIPASVRMLLALALALWMTASFPELTSDRYERQHIFALALSEVSLGLALALCFQWAFAVIFMAGRPCFLPLVG